MFKNFDQYDMNYKKLLFLHLGFSVIGIINLIFNLFADISIAIKFVIFIHFIAVFCLFSFSLAKKTLHSFCFYAFVGSTIFLVTLTYILEPHITSLLFFFIIPVIAIFILNNLLTLISGIITIGLFNYFGLRDLHILFPSDVGVFDFIFFNAIFVIALVSSYIQVILSNQNEELIKSQNINLNKEKNSILEKNVRLENTSHSLDEFKIDLTESVNGVVSASNQAIKSLKTTKREFDELGVYFENSHKNIKSNYAESKKIFDSGEEINSNISSNTQHMSFTKEKINELYRSMELLDKDFESTLQDTVSLNQKIEEIEFIVKFVKEITKKINLLSLNASIEATKAGVHGNGFKVVAEEVKKLAEQSAESTKEISDILAIIQVMMANVSNKVVSSKDEISSKKELSSEVSVSFGLVDSNNFKISRELQSVFSELNNLKRSTEEIYNDINQIDSSYKDNLQTFDELLESYDHINTLIKDIDFKFSELKRKLED